MAVRSWFGQRRLRGEVSGGIVARLALALALGMPSGYGSEPQFGGSVRSSRAAVDESRPTIIARFVEECISVRPGNGTFPAELHVRQAADEGPPETRILKPMPFRMCRFETTQELYQVVTGQNPSRWKGPRNSVEMVTAEEAEGFCVQLTRMLHEQKLIAPNQSVRLPTREEWEYACRAGSAGRYGLFKPEASEAARPLRKSELGRAAWFTANAAGNDPPVGALLPNVWGLYDMHGYIAELVLDGPDAGKRVVCGGSWKDTAEALQCDAARPIPAGVRSDDIGFRCVIAQKPMSEQLQKP